MSEGFRFSDAERADIRGALRKRPQGAVDDYLVALENDIACWREDWPAVSAADLRTVRRRLANMEKHLELLLFEIRSLPRNAWPHKVPRNTAELEGLLIAVQEEKAHRSTGYENHRKFDLARRAALSYCHAFKKRPTRTPNSPYMACIDAIGQAAGIIIGKDLAGDGLDAGIEEYNRRIRHFGISDI
jgi:hypothetical protein